MDNAYYACMCYKTNWRYICVYIFIFIHARVPDVYLTVRVCVCVCIHIYIYIYVYIYIYISIYIYMCINNSNELVERVRACLILLLNQKACRNASLHKRTECFHTYPHMHIRHTGCRFFEGEGGSEGGCPGLRGSPRDALWSSRYQTNYADF